ncbi:MAG: hypothetical protein ABR927_18545 [Bacteroidales bacterium]|jgi:hypothetical protein
MKRIDSQITSMAGEFLTVGKLFKKGVQASVTFGNAKKIDILAYNPENKKNFNIQVKTLRKKNCFPIKKESIDREHIYVFIILYNSEKEEDYFIIKGSDILENINKFFGALYNKDVASIMPAINYGSLKEYKDNWRIFD